MHLKNIDYHSSECLNPSTTDLGLKALQLTEALGEALEGQNLEQDSLRKEVSTKAADVILQWLERGEVSAMFKQHQSGIINHFDRKPDIVKL